MGGRVVDVVGEEYVVGGFVKCSDVERVVVEFVNEGVNLCECVLLILYA